MSSYSFVFCCGVFVWFLLFSGIDWCSLLIPKSPFPIRIRNQKTYYPTFNFPSGKCALCLAFVSWLKTSIKDRNRSLISRQANNPPCDITIIIVNMVFTFKDLFDIKKSSHFVWSSLILLDIIYLSQLCACAVKNRFDIQAYLSPGKWYKLLQTDGEFYIGGNFWIKSSAWIENPLLYCVYNFASFNCFWWVALYLDLFWLLLFKVVKLFFHFIKCVFFSSKKVEKWAR